MSESESLLSIDENRVVSLHYQLSNGFGEIIDSSLGGLPLVYMHNTNALLPSLERELTGAYKGDNLDIVIYPEDGYGYANEELIQELDKDAFGHIGELKQGMRIRAKSSDADSQLLTVKEILEDTVIVDANHPLAGQVLHFNISVVAVREPSEKEQEEGLAISSNTPSSSPIRS